MQYTHNIQPSIVHRPPSTVILRADGNSKIGLGHISRCLALAEMLSAEFDCIFITREIPESIENQINSICKGLYKIPVHVNVGTSEAEWISKHLSEKGEIFILDGYHFNTDYQRVIRAQGYHLICIDDLADKHYVADVVINHTGGWSAKDFSAESHTQFWLGAKYALLKQPFLEAAKKRDFSISRNQNILLCLGGADPKNDTLHILKKLKSLGTKEKIKVIVGAAYLHRDELEKYTSLHLPNVELFSNIPPNKMVAVMRECPVAILPPSTIAYEYLHVGGILFLHQIADNQKYIKKYLLQHKLAFELNKLGELTEKDFQIATYNQRKIFDGRSGERILTQIFLSVENNFFTKKNHQTGMSGLRI